MSPSSLTLTITLALALSLLTPQTLALPPPPNTIWQVTPPLNHTDALYAGIPPLPLSSQTLVYNGTQTGRTYAHHPSLYHSGGGGGGARIFLQYSTSPIDEDSTGQESWLSASTDGGRTWTQGRSILPTALLANQTRVGAANYSFWCAGRVWQRAVHPVAWVADENEEILYAVSQVTLRYCWSDTAKGTKGGGRIARRINRDGNPVGDPCWTEKNHWTDVVRFNETVYGLEYGMKYCEHAAYIERYLKEPETTPAWGSWLYGTKMYAGDGVHDVQEPTHAVWFGDGNATKAGYWQRFWRDISNSTTISNNVWIERTPSPNGEDWYPNIEQQYNNTAILETNIPDVGSKSHYGVLPSGTTYLIHNPRKNTERYRQPLTIATSRVGDGGRFTGIGVLRTNASTVMAPDTRGLKRLMMSYPSAVLVGGKLVVAYSENKENIWVSIVGVGDLL
ncbi:hypothetical protein CC80DRAFT_475708 [Byssothecium circinans]|uniref:BT-1020-like N-terminal beta-propeller domain-containing protein n=1 Tax=Byssothecium circinans TaxID=147558 RepID=A0A6A5TPF0_9PLEO|nr:hypothetical protein CC80DRAFT_475708 [Byssothecium circinans]